MSKSVIIKKQFLGTGRRKNAVARVRIAEGSGNFTINKHKVTTYCNTETMLQSTIAPLKIIKIGNNLDVNVLVHGGGTSGQSEAIAHGIARALQSMKPEFRSILKKEGYIRRDPRMKERKKSGQPGARKRFQFSKR